MAVSRRIGSAAVGMFAVLAVVAALNLPVTVILAHELEPSGYGQFQFLNRLAFIAVTVAQVGLPHALAWAMSQTTTTRERRAIYQFSCTSSLGAGGVIGFIGLIAASLGWHPADNTPWLILCIYPALNLCSAAVASCARGVLDLKQVALIRIPQATLWFLGVLLLVLTNRLTVTTAVAVLVFSQATSAAISLGIARPYVSTTITRTAKSLSEIWQFARRVFLGQTIMSWNLYLDQVILGFLLPPSQLGVYAAAAGLTFSLSIISGAISAVAQPIVQKASDRFKVTTQLIAVTFVIVALAAGSLAAAAQMLVRLVLGAAYQDSVQIIHILCCAALLDGLNACVYGILLGLNFPKVASQAAVLGLAANVAGWITLLPMFGITGAATTSVAAYLCVFVRLLLGLRKALGVSLYFLLSGAGRELVAAPALIIKLLASGASGRLEGRI